MAKIRIRVKVDPSGNVEVTGRPKRRALVKDEDTLTFSSNRKGTAIKFVSSPIAEFRAGGVIRNLERAKGPYLVIRDGKHHIDCGHIVAGIFKRWALAGEDIPPPC